MITWITTRLLAEGLVTPKYHGVARHELAEREATHRAITFAEFVATPLLVVHVSGRQAAAEIARARTERGSAVFGETCPQYLTLTAQKLEGVAPAEGRGGGHGGGDGDSHGQDHDHSASLAGEWEGSKYLCSPPLRAQEDVDALWAALREGSLQVVRCALAFCSLSAPHTLVTTPWREQR
jgi:dihydropyrimidinase